MVSTPIAAAKGAPCPDCGLAWDTPGAKHCQKGAGGSVFGVDGCKRRPLIECFVGGVRVASWCPVGAHLWRRSAMADGSK
jgi:hypothetical protein